MIFERICFYGKVLINFCIARCSNCSCICSVHSQKGARFFRGNRENAENTFSELLNLGVIPVVNENDTVSTEEVEFGELYKELKSAPYGLRDGYLSLLLANALLKHRKSLIISSHGNEQEKS